MTAALALAALAACLGSQSPAPQPPIVRGIDHFFATSSDPEPLFKVFRDTLGLPEVYPFRAYDGFSSGVVSMGNVLFEVATWSVPQGEVLPTELKGIAFEPSERLPITLERLRERGVAHQEPEEVMFTIEGRRVPGYVNVGLDGAGGLPPVDAAIFINDNLGSPQAAESREQGARELEKRGGGPLGIVGVRELVVSVEDPDAASSQWSRLLAAPAVTRDGVITFDAGPAVLVVPSMVGGLRIRLIEGQ